MNGHSSSKSQNTEMNIIIGGDTVHCTTVHFVVTALTSVVCRAVGRSVSRCERTGKRGDLYIVYLMKRREEKEREWGSVDG